MTVERNVDAEIDALLSRNESDSVIDTLLEIPHVATANDENWEKILNARLQERLARKMRELLENEPERKDSRSAA